MKWLHESLKADILLTAYVDVCCEWKQLEFEAMAFILGTAVSNSSFKIDTFKYWCLVKEKSSQSTLLALTVHDIICPNDSLDESMSLDINEWPFNVIKDMDYEKFLLDEIRSYVKARKINKQNPTIAVYKKALKVVKDKQILAKIICCTVDALTSDPDNQICLTNLETAINSLIKMINKNGGQDSLMGDLYYMSARCELSTIRKASQVEVIDMKEVLPLPEDLSDRNSNKLLPSISQFSKLLKCLKLASEHWKKALVENLIVDYDTISYIKGVAYLYRLLKCTALEIETWNFLYDVSKKLNFEKHMILAVSELLESKLDVDESKIIEIKALSLSSQHKDTYYHHLFLTQLARNKLKNSKYEEAINILSEVDRKKLTYSAINQGRWYLIDFLVKNADENQLPTDCPLKSLFDSYSYIRFIFNKTEGTFCENCVIQSLAFELCIVLAKTLYYASDVTKVAQYCNKFSKSTSLMALPLRRCEFHCEMAQLSVMMSSKTELYNQITDIESILEVNLNKNLSSDQGKVWREKMGNQPEQLLILISLHSLWGRYYQLNNKCQQSIKIFTNGINLVNCVKKIMTQELLDSLLEHEMRLYLNSATALICWGKYPKAKTYCDYVLSRYKGLKIKDKLFLQYARTLLLCSVVPQVDFNLTTCEIPFESDDVQDENTPSTPVDDKKLKRRARATQGAPRKIKLIDSESELPVVTPKPYHKNLILPVEKVKKGAGVTEENSSTLDIRQKCSKTKITTPNEMKVFQDSSDSGPSSSSSKSKLNFISSKVNIKINLSDDSDVSVIESSPVLSVNRKARKKYNRKK